MSIMFTLIIWHVSRTNQSLRHKYVFITPWYTRVVFIKILESVSQRSSSRSLWWKANICDFKHLTPSGWISVTTTFENTGWNKYHYFEVAYLSHFLFGLKTQYSYLNHSHIYPLTRRLRKFLFAFLALEPKPCGERKWKLKRRKGCCQLFCFLFLLLVVCFYLNEFKFSNSKSVFNHPLFFSIWIESKHFLVFDIIIKVNLLHYRKT